MALVLCPACRTNTLIHDGKCQHCGSPVKIPIWKRKMRRREAYGLLLVVTGIGAFPLYKGIGAIVFLAGAGLIAYSFFVPRVRF